jgi:hypothetical protein
MTGVLGSLTLIASRMPAACVLTSAGSLSSSLSSCAARPVGSQLVNRMSWLRGMT